MNRNRFYCYSRQQLLFRLSVLSARHTFIIQGGLFAESANVKNNHQAQFLSCVGIERIRRGQEKKNVQN